MDVWNVDDVMCSGGGVEFTISISIGGQSHDVVHALQTPTPAFIFMTLFTVSPVSRPPLPQSQSSIESLCYVQLHRLFTR